MNNTALSPKRLLVEAAREHLRSLSDNIATDTAGQSRCRGAYDRTMAIAPASVDKDTYLAQMENFNQIISKLKRERDLWEQALSLALGLLEQP